MIKNVSLLEDVLGFFILVINPNLTCIFIYFDVKENQITKYELHKGKQTFKKFNEFLSKTIDSEIRCKEGNKRGMKLYVPKNYLNGSIKSQCELLGLELIKYLEYDRDRPELLKIIKLYIKSYNLTKVTLDKLNS